MPCPVQGGQRASPGYQEAGLLQITIETDVFVFEEGLECTGHRHEPEHGPTGTYSLSRIAPPSPEPVAGTVFAKVSSLCSTGAQHHF